MAVTTRKSSQSKEISREMVEAWEKRHPSLKALNDATLDKPRGYVIAKSDAVAMCGGEKEFGKVASKWKECVLWLRGITVEYDHKSRGYKFIQVDGHLIDRNDRILRSHEKKHREESLRLGLMRADDLSSEHHQKLRVLQMNQHSDIAGKLNAQREYVRLALRQPETLPRIVGG